MYNTHKTAKMHSRTVDPIPLQESASDYSFSGFSEYFWNNRKANPMPMTGYPSCYPYIPYGEPHPPVEQIVPHENDVLMGRGGKNNQHIGNERLRQLARVEAKEYSVASKKRKSAIAKGLVSSVRNMSPPGRFLKRNPLTLDWEDVGDDYAREKTSQVMRDAVALLPVEDITFKQEDKSLEEDLERKSKRKATGNRVFEPETSRRAQPIKLDLDDPPMPALKRQRTNRYNFFERYALTPAFARSDSLHSLGGELRAPCLSRQGSLEMTGRTVSFDDIKMPLSVAPLLSDDDDSVGGDLMGTEEAFFSDFF